MLLTNRLFFEQVEAMLAEGHEVQIRMKGHSMRPLLRNERDIAVLTPIAKYAPAPVPAAGAPADPVPETRAADGNASTARQTRLSGDTPGTAPDLHTPACGTRHPAPPPSGHRAPCGRATSSCFAAKGAISCTASSGSKQASAAKETVPYAHQPQGMPRPLRHPRKTPQRGIPPRGRSVSPCPGTVITARRSIASARISSP